MKLMEGIKILKRKYPEYIILIKNGIFYNAIGKDAIFLSKEFKLKKICFSTGVCKIGINENQIKKFSSELRKRNYKYIIFNYIKGEYKDIEEQFIEHERKDNGITIKEKYETDCNKCDYNERIKKREKIQLTENQKYKGDNEIKKEEIKKIVKKMINNYIKDLLEKNSAEEDNEQ